MKRKLFPFFLCSGLFLTCVAPTMDAGIPGIPLPATELTQIANYMKLLQQTTQQAQQIQLMFEQLQWLVYNSKQLATHPVTTIQNDLMALNGIVQQSQGLAYGMGKMDEQFVQMFPDYDPHTDFTKSYATWSGNLMKTIRGTLGSVGLQGQDLMSEQSVLQQIHQLSLTPMGQAEAVQLGNVISQETNFSLAKLRQIMVEDISSQNAFMGYQVQKDASVQQANHNAFPGTDWQSDHKAW